MRTIYVYISSTVVVKGSIAFATVIERLRDSGIDVVDFDEVSRRIVVRAPASHAGLLATAARSYAESIVFEIKASAMVPREWKPPKEWRVTRVGDRLLFYTYCDETGWAVWGEKRSRRLLLKLCRRGVMVDPAMLPESLCSFRKQDLENLGSLIDKALRCFRKVVQG